MCIVDHYWVQYCPHNIDKMDMGEISSAYVGSYLENHRLYISIQSAISSV